MNICYDSEDKFEDNHKLYIQEGQTIQWKSKKDKTINNGQQITTHKTKISSNTNPIKSWGELRAKSKLPLQRLSIAMILLHLYTWISVAATNLVVLCRASTTMMNCIMFIDIFQKKKGYSLSSKSQLIHTSTESKVN